ncbi:MAG: glycosyltransferase family 2 protein [Candidatus Dormibacterales bacterium]
MSRSAQLSRPRRLGEDPPRRVLAVMMPVYNEARTLGAILAAVLERPEVAEVIVVDDGSTDGTWEILARAAAQDGRVRALRQERNRGKGAALRRAVAELTAPFAIVQDADLEYSPDDYPALLRPLVNGSADAVFGVRGFAGHTAYSYWFVQGNRGLTWACNVLFNCYISDLLTGYKALRSELWRRLAFRREGFAADAEITARLLRLGYRVHEVPISYVTRSREEGKKVRVRDGVSHLGALLAVRLQTRAYLFGADDGYHGDRHVELATRRAAERARASRTA